MKSPHGSKATRPPARRGRPPAIARADRATSADPGVIAESVGGVQAVERALDVLEAFADGATRLTLSELAQRTGLYPSTILRLATSLARFGYMVRDREGFFRLGPSLCRLGALYQASFDLAAVVRPVLHELATATGETAAFYIIEGEARICLFRVEGSRPIRSHVIEGAALPLDAGASARILMAYAPAVGSPDVTEAERPGEERFYAAIRKRGSYVSRGERDPESAAVAVPVFQTGARFLGALGVIGPVSRFDAATAKRYEVILVETAARLSRALGHTAAVEAATVGDRRRAATPGRIKSRIKK